MLSSFVRDTGIDPVITCSDASLGGLGVSRSIGLTPEGWTLFQHAFSRTANTWTPLPDGSSDLREPRVLSIGLFDGIGGLRRALECLRVRVMLNVSVEKESRASRVVREAWPGTIEVDDIFKVTRDYLSRLIVTAAELGVRLVILAGGWPCQGVSQLNRDRVGVGGSRSGLFVEFIRVAEATRSLAESRDMKFLGVGECTVMDAKDEKAITDACGWSRVRLCAGGMSRVRRPRLYWTSSAIQERPWLEIAENWKGRECIVTGPLEPADLWVLLGWKFPAESSAERIPTSHKRLRCGSLHLVRLASSRLLLMSTIATAPTRGASRLTRTETSIASRPLQRLRRGTRSASLFVLRWRRRGKC